jgi:hypothetical protein
MLSGRWIVERAFGWTNRRKRLAKALEAAMESVLQWILFALTFLLTRRLARLLTQARDFASTLSDLAVREPCDPLEF